jgi:hypothetical protein
MARFVRKKIRAKFFVITISERFPVQMTGARKLLHVVAVSFIIPLELGQSDIVRLQRVKP